MTNDLDLKSIRKWPYKLRDKYGAHSREGGIISTLIEQLRTDQGAQERGRKYIPESVAHLAKLTGSAIQ